MRLLVLIFGLFYSIVLSAQNETKIIECSGTISDKYPIKMVLKIEKEKTIGYYYYEKYKTKILLSGDIQGTRIILNESPDLDQNFTHGFIGTINKNIISGIWKDVYKRKSFEFKVVVDKEKVSVPNDEAIEGMYENETGSISLKHITDKYFLFVICTGTENCTGFLEGLIEFPDLKSGYYSDNVCKELKINVGSGFLEVKEKDCNYHGMSCWFSGKYKKIEKKSSS